MVLYLRSGGRRWLLLAVIVLCGCDSGDRLDGPPVFAEWAVSNVFRMGDLDHPDYAFGSVGAIAVADDGSIYTAHPQELEIRVWTEGGAPVRILGGGGQGPGEFQALGAIGFIGDTLWAIDGRASRVTFFLPSGDVLRTSPITRAVRGAGSDPSMGRPFTTHALADGTFFGRQSGLLPQMADRDSTLIHLSHFDDKTSVLDSLFTYPFRRRDGMAVPGPSGNDWLYGYQPFSDQPLTSVAAELGALLVVDRTAYGGEGRPTYRITTISMSGDTLLHREVEYDAEPIDALAVAQVVEGLVGRWRSQVRGGDAVDLESLAREALFVPSYYPPVSAAALGEDGSIWLRTARSDSVRIEWLIFDAAGDPVARVPLSTNFQIRTARAAAAWGVVSDNRGVPYVTRYEVGPTVAAGGR